MNRKDEGLEQNDAVHLTCLSSLGSLHYPASSASCRRAPPSPFLLSSGAGGGLRREVNDRRDEPNDGGRHRAEGDIKDRRTEARDGLHE